MKCTYRLVVVLGGILGLLLMLGFSGDVTRMLRSEVTSGCVDLVSSQSKAPSDTDLQSIKPRETTLVKGTDKDAVTHRLIPTVGSATQARPHEGENRIQKSDAVVGNGKERMVLAVVCCGNRINETQIMLKSAAALSHSPLTMIVFTEDELKPAFKQMYISWPTSVQKRITLDLHSITFPPGQDAKAWRKLFKPCASQRLFMPSLLKDVDALVYVDTDVMFLAPLEELWKHFSAMNASHMAAMAPEHEDLATGWYNRFAKHPYYGRLGVNSGVMLMNLTRLRKFGWEEYVVPIYKHYKLAITWGDQDIINIIFHYHSDKLYVYGCEYNLRPDHCMYMSVCKAAEKHGVFVLHGNRGTFHSDKQPAFRAVYRAWEEYKLGDDLRQNLYYPMQRYLIKTTNTNCGKIHSAYLKALGSLVRLR